jgi:hypothetical protein
MYLLYCYHEYNVLEVFQHLSVEVHAWNPSTQEAEARRYKFKASLGYIARPCLKKRKKEKENRLGTSGSCLSS